MIGTEKLLNGIRELSRRGLQGVGSRHVGEGLVSEPWAVQKYVGCCPPCLTTGRRSGGRRVPRSVVGGPARECGRSGDD